MVCKNCNASLEEGAKFCPACGCKVEDEAVAETVAEVEEKVNEVVSETEEEIKEEAKEEELVICGGVTEVIPEEIPVVPSVTETPAAVETAVVASSLASAVEKVPENTIPAAPVEEAKKEVKPSRKAIRDKKKFEKQAKVQEVIDGLPGEYKPVSTSTYFWLGIFGTIPVIGFILTIFLSFTGKNKNRKNFMKAIFVWHVIGIILALIAGLVLTFVFPDSMATLFDAFSDLIIDLGFF